METALIKDAETGLNSCLTDIAKPITKIFCHPELHRPRKHVVIMCLEWSLRKHSIVPNMTIFLCINSDHLLGIILNEYLIMLTPAFFPDNCFLFFMTRKMSFIGRKMQASKKVVFLNIVFREPHIFHFLDRNTISVIHE